MATIRREIAVGAAPDAAWDAVRDVGAAHRRLCPGVLTDCRLEERGPDAPRARLVTFANGMEVREVIVTVDDAARRFAWSARSPGFVHHNASLEVMAGEGGGSLLVWIADVLPDELAPMVGGLMEAGAAAMQRALPAG
jgi:hypothetical protein